MFIFFRKLPWRKPGSTPEGFTMVGIVADDGLVYFEKYNRIRKVPLERIKRKPHVIRRIREEFDQGKISEFLRLNQGSATLIQAAFRAIYSNRPEYFSRPIRTPPHDPIDTQEHQRRCELLAKHAQPADLLFTFNPSNVMSRVITSIDNSLWSHVAGVVQGGDVIEAVPSGVRRIKLEHYLQWPYRLGLYRFASSLTDPVGFENELQSLLGDRYSFIKAALCGISQFLPRRWRLPLPSDLALSEALYLECRV